MKILKYFILIMSFAEYTIMLQASKGMPKTAAPLEKKAFGITTTTTLAPRNINQTQSEKYTPYQASTYTKIKIPAFTPYKQDQPLAKPLQITDTFQETINHAIPQPGTINVITKTEFEPLLIPELQPALNLQHPIMYQKPTGTNFAFKGMPNSFKKFLQPKTNQLLLTHDPSYQSTIIEPIAKQSETTNMESSQSKQLKEPSPQDVIESQNKKIINPELEKIKAIEPQQETFDTDQAYINSKINILTQSIENWVHEYTQISSNMHSQANLKDDIINALTNNNKQKKLNLISLTRNANVIEKLLETYKNNPDVKNVLNDIEIKIKQDMTSKQVSSKTFDGNQPGQKLTFNEKVNEFRKQYATEDMYSGADKKLDQELGKIIDTLTLDYGHSLLFGSMPTDYSVHLKKYNTIQEQRQMSMAEKQNNINKQRRAYRTLGTTAQNAAQSVFNATGIPTAINNVSQGIKNTAQNITTGISSVLQPTPQATITIT